LISATRFSRPLVTSSKAQVPQVLQEITFVVVERLLFGGGK
jgi:hypothetical protein